MNGKRKTVSTEKATQMLGVSTATVIRLIQQGELEAYKLTLGLTSPYRIYLDSIERFLEQRQQPAR